jgi:glutathione S-transferase
MKLTYFDVYGKAEPIRLLLNHAGVEFEDIRLTGAEFGAIKGDKTKLPYGTLPVLEKDGKVYAQSVAILRMLGATHGYYPEDAESRYQVDQLIDLIDDFAKPIYTIRFNSKLSDEEK